MAWVVSVSLLLSPSSLHLPSGLFKKKKGAGFKGIRPNTAAARRARWADTDWTAEGCAVGSRRPLGASASNPGRLSESARGGRQGYGQHSAHKSLLLWLLRWRTRWYGTLVEPYSSDSSFRRLHENSSLRVIFFLCRVPCSLAVTNNNNNHKNRCELSYFVDLINSLELTELTNTLSKY